jgi:hypothetical protein
MARDLALEQTWRDRVERQQRSGLTVPVFCKREGFVAHQFFWWRRELKRRVAGMPRAGKRSRVSKKATRKVAVDGSGFVPVHVASVLRNGSGIELVLDQPWRIALGQGFDPEVLVELLRVLETRPC